MQIQDRKRKPAVSELIAPAKPMPQPGLRGWVATVYVKGNGPYYVRRWKQNGKLNRQYVKKKDLDRVRAACEANRQNRRRQIQAANTLATMTGNLTFYSRMFERALSGKLAIRKLVHLERIASDGLLAPNRPPLRRPSPSKAFMVPSPAIHRISARDHQDKQD